MGTGARGGNSIGMQAAICSAIMTDPTTRAVHARLAFGGLIALASGMGLGRFLYTPALPMMVEGAGLSPSQAGLIASANFAGYLAGALAAGLPGMSPRAWNWLMAALVASAATTAAMAMSEGFWAWVLLRFVGGWASAFILVFTTTLVAVRLRAAGGYPGMGGMLQIFRTPAPIIIFQIPHRENLNRLLWQAIHLDIQTQAWLEPQCCYPVGAIQRLGKSLVRLGNHLQAHHRGPLVLSRDPAPASTARYMFPQRRR